MTWNITNCVFDTDDGPDTEYYISSQNGEYLSVRNDKIVASPTLTDLNNFLIGIQQNKVIHGWHVKLSDAMWINSPSFGPFNGPQYMVLTIPLGNLTICFNDADPVPTLTWHGEPNEDFNLLNRYFRRWHNLKAFW